MLRAPLVFVSPGQINAQVPYDVAGPEIAVRVRTSAGVSNEVTVTVQPGAPRLLTTTMDGRGEAILLDSNYGLVSEQAPALPDQAMMLYLVGLGAVTPPVAAGAPAGDGQTAPLNETELAPEVFVAGHRAEVLWSGLAPYYAGLYQLNIRLPRHLPQGRHTIQVVAGSNSSQAGVWMAGGSPVVSQSASTASVGAGGGTVSGAGLEVRIPAGG